VELTSRATRRLRGRPRDREGRAGAAPRRRRGKRREAVETLEPGGVGGSGGAEAREGMGHRRVGAPCACGLRTPSALPCRCVCALTPDAIFFLHKM
jgi:hypothetical protein